LLISFIEPLIFRGDLHVLARGGVTQKEGEEKKSIFFLLLRLPEN